MKGWEHDNYTYRRFGISWGIFRDFVTSDDLVGTRPQTYYVPQPFKLLLPRVYGLCLHIWLWFAKSVCSCILCIFLIALIIVLFKIIQWSSNTILGKSRPCQFFHIPNTTKIIVVGTLRLLFMYLVVNTPKRVRSFAHVKIGRVLFISA